MRVLFPTMAAAAAAAVVMLLALVSSTQAASSPPPSVALSLTFSNCRGFTDEKGVMVRLTEQYLSCDPRGATRKAVGKGQAAVFEWETMPEHVHCKTFKTDKGDRGDLYGKWSHLSKTLRSGKEVATFRLENSNRAGGTCDVVLSIGGQEVNPDVERLYARVIAIEGLNKGPAQARTSNPFLRVDYGGVKCGELRAATGTVFDLGVVTNPATAAQFELQDGAGRSLEFSKVLLNVATIKGVTSFPLRSPTIQGNAAVLSVEFFRRTPSVYAKELAEAAKKDAVVDKAAADQKEVDAKKTDKPDDETPTTTGTTPSTTTSTSTSTTNPQPTTTTSTGTGTTTGTTTSTGTGTTTTSRTTSSRMRR